MEVFPGNDIQKAARSAYEEGYNHASRERKEEIARLKAENGRLRAEKAKDAALIRGLVEKLILPGNGCSERPAGSPEVI